MRPKLKLSPSTDHLLSRTGIMKKLLAATLKHWAGMPAVLVTSLLLSGCGHLYYADPNPGKPYTFPGETPSKAAGMSPSMAGNARTAPPLVAPVGTTAPLNTGPGRAVGTAAGTGPARALKIGGSETGRSSMLHVGDKVTVSFSDV